MDLFQDGTKPPADKEPAPAAKQTTASDSQGESKLSRIADHKVLSDFPALLALYHRQKAEGRINCTPRQFFAAAICARNEVQINGGDELAFFAWIVNGARWGSISDDGTWQSAQQALDGAVRQRDDRHYVTAVKSLAARFGNDPFHVARKHRPQLTREEWDGIESGAAGP